MPEHMTDAHFSFTFVFKQALNRVHVFYAELFAGAKKLA